MSPVTTATQPAKEMNTAEFNKQILSEIEQRKKDAAMAEQQQAEQLSTSEQLQKEIAKLTAELESTRKSAAEAAEHAEKARIDAENRSKALLPDAVDLRTAEIVARDLLAAVVEFDREFSERELLEFQRRGVSTTEAATARLWQALDSAKQRIGTTDIAPDARRLVLAIHSLLEISDEFESVRQPDYQVERSMVGESPMDMRMVESPRDCQIFNTMAKELRKVLDGEAFSPAKEDLGELIGQGVAINQIARMFGLVLVNNEPDLRTLGLLVSRGIRGEDLKTVLAHKAIVRTGCTSFEDAWAFRQSEVTRLRNLPSSFPGAVQTDVPRPGRLANAMGQKRKPQGPTDMDILRKRRNEAAYEKRVAEKANEPEPQQVPDESLANLGNSDRLRNLIL